GMLGHKLWQSALPRFETKATVRSRDWFAAHGFPQESITAPVDVHDHDALARAFDAARPDVVVNCAGIIKQLAAAKDAIASISINSLFPHQLAERCAAAGARLIHLSTDCVFSGRRGSYSEADTPDAGDLYGRSKLLGEVTAPRCLTIRTSMIGREIATTNGLVEWLLSRRGSEVRGFARAIFSGLTTNALANIILDVTEYFPDLAGLYHVAAEPIDKFTLLQRLNVAYDARVEIRRDESVVIDRSLDASRFRAATGFVPP